MRRAIANLLTPPGAGAADGDGKAGATGEGGSRGGWATLLALLRIRRRVDTANAAPAASAGDADAGESSSKPVTADDVLASPFIAYLGSPGVGNTFRVSYVSAWQLLQGALDAANGGRQAGFVSVASIQKMIEPLPHNSPLQKVLADLCMRAGNDIEAFRKLLDEWYGDLEKQMSAWYRQKTQYVVVGISVFVAGAMNVDTIDIATRLYRDSALRATITEQALKAAGSGDIETFIGSKARDDARTAFEQAEVARNEAAEKLDECQSKKPASPDAAGDNSCQEALQKDAEAAEQALEAAREALEKEQRSLDQRIRDRVDTISGAGLALGWSTWNPGQGAGVLATLGALFTKVIGLLMSAGAFSLGAPFWFNMLKTAASIRSVGRSPKEEKPGSGSSANA